MCLIGFNPHASAEAVSHAAQAAVCGVFCFAFLFHLLSSCCAFLQLTISLHCCSFFLHIRERGPSKMLTLCNALSFLMLLLLCGGVGVCEGTVTTKPAVPPKVVGSVVDRTKVLTSVDLPADVKETRNRALRATQHAFDNATEAAKQCLKAKLDADEAKSHADEAKKLLEKLGGDFVSKSTALQAAKKAHDEAVAALRKCVEAERAAADADTAVVAALYEVLNHSKVQRPTSLSPKEAWERVHRHSLQAVKEAQKAEVHAEKAAEAAQKASEAAKKAATALITAKEVVAMADELKKKLAKEEEERRKQHEEFLASEKRKIQEEAAKAVKRAEAAEEIVAELSSTQKRNPKTGARGTRIGVDGAQNPRHAGQDRGSYASALAPSLLLLLAVAPALASLVLLC
ncbi:mucin-associated surface protein (MASP) [Trypanosoma conorhini]|uniref:Mucin-associated surface protein (MASP) n=1 Tax=Trypanosoma conorhini TaxID=83891 RepID=A0A3R7MBN7_9TRYP|nr:mucin-associated surface protein (MASP) [Trypanosoma conorhini]RNF02916.1 mucin-associated surface protein (MASP) [Trypanosoma conorhini]